MPLSFGRKFLAIPGPTTVPDEVLQAMHRPAIDIYGGDVEPMTYSLLDDLKRIFRTERGHGPGYQRREKPVPSIECGFHGQPAVHHRHLHLQRHTNTSSSQNATSSSSLISAQ